MGFFGSLTGSDQAKAASRAAEDTYKKQIAAVENQTAAGTNYQNTLFDLAKAYDPYTRVGLAGNDALLRLINDPSSVRSLPGYQFAQSEGLQGLDRSAAARGLGQSGRAVKDALRFSTGLADQTYGNQLARLMGLNQAGMQATGAQVGTETQGATGNLGARTTAYNNMFNSSGTIGQGEIAGANARAAGAQNLLNAGVSLGGQILGGAGGFGGVTSGLGKLYGGLGNTFGFGYPGANIPGAASNWGGYNMTGT